MIPKNKMSIAGTEAEKKEKGKLSSQKKNPKKIYLLNFN